MQATIGNSIGRVPGETVTVGTGTGRDSGVAGRKPWPVLLCGAGLAVMSVAGLVQWNAGGGSGGGGASTSGAPAVAAVAAVAGAAGPEGLTIQSEGAITVLPMTYEPGQTSGWHRHAGIHAVAILSGALTVYDQNCQAHVYAPGEPYIGGQQVHLVRNEGATAVEMIVTYLNPATAGAAPAPPEPTCGVR
ncbi:MAG: cupin domain-containing protein [Acidimicrobiales bacterium]